MLRRAAALVVPLLLSAALVWSCRPAAVEPPSVTVVSLVGWGMPEERAIVREALATFERQNPQIRVSYTQVPGVGYDYLNKLRLMIVAGRAPDVFYVPDGAFGAMVEKGALRALDDLVAASDVLDLGDMWATAVMRYRWNGHALHDGKLYALPKDIGPAVLYYNKDVLRRRGVAPPDPEEPMTWDEAIRMWRALTYREGHVQHWGISGYPYEAAVWSSGAEIVDGARRAFLLAAPAASAAVQWCADLALREHVAPNLARSGGAGNSELFEAGLAAMHVDGRWMVPRYRRLSFDWDVAPLPVPERGMPSIGWSGSVGLAISASSKHPREAFKLIEYLAGPAGQAELARSGLLLPNQRSVAKTDAFFATRAAPVARGRVRARRGGEPARAGDRDAQHLLARCPHAPHHRGVARRAQGRRAAPRALAPDRRGAAGR
jgi:multiple sugar transport system substrate-binding protein